MYQEDIYYVELMIGTVEGIGVQWTNLRIMAGILNRQFDGRYCQILQIDKTLADENFKRLWGLVYAEDGCLLGVLLQQDSGLMALVTQIQPSTGQWKWTMPSGIEVYPESHTPDLDVRDYVNFIVKHDVR